MIGFARTGLVTGVFLWWLFMATSLLRPNIARAAIGWLAFALVVVAIAHTLSVFGVAGGWLVDAISSALPGIAAASYLNRALPRKKPEDYHVPFAGQM